MHIIRVCSKTVPSDNIWHEKIQSLVSHMNRLGDKYLIKDIYWEFNTDCPCTKHYSILVRLDFEYKGNVFKTINFCRNEETWKLGYEELEPTIHKLLTFYDY